MIAEVQGFRLSLSWREVEDFKRKCKQYGRYIHGDEPPRYMDEGRRTPENRLTEAQKEKRALGRGWIVATYPMHSLTLNALSPAAVSRYGTWVDQQKAVPENATDEESERILKFNGLQQIFRQLAMKIDKLSDTRQQLRAAFSDGMLGMGWLESGYDREHGIGCIKWANTFRVMVDIEPDSDPFGKLQRWNAIAGAMPIDEADYALKNEWNQGEGESDDVWTKKGHEFKPLSGKVERDDGTIEETPTRMCRLVWVYKCGDSPYLSGANLDAEKGEPVEVAGDDPVYKNGKDEVLIFEALGELTEKSQYVLVARFPWPFPAMPFTPIWFTDDNSKFYKPAFYQASHAMCVAANGAIRDFVTKTFQLTRMIMLVRQGAFNKKQMEDALFGPDAMRIVEALQNGAPEQLIQAAKMGDMPKELAEAIGLTSSLFDTASQRQVLENQQRSHQPATNAALMDAQKQLRIDEVADRVERCYQTAMEKALVACSATMSAEEVARHIGDEYMGWYTPDGETGRVSRFWDDSIDDPRALRERVTIALQPRSVRFVSDTQKMLDLDKFAATAMNMWTQISAANQGNPQLAGAMAKFGNALMAEYADLLHLDHRESLKVDLNAAVSQPVVEPPEVSMTQSETPEGTDVTVKGPPDAAQRMMGAMANKGMDVEPAMNARIQ